MIDDTPEIHLLRRLTYGTTEAELARMQAIGADCWLDEQLEPQALDTAAVDQMLADAFPELDRPAAELLAEYRADGNGGRLANVLTAALLHRHLRSPAQLHERMVEFWADHFNVPQIGPAATAARIEMDRQVFRRHALGRFDELLVATAQSPAMLLYLDNFRSTAGRINENYARELLELHTVGIDGGYDEDDVVAVARLLTGWTLTRRLGFRFAARRHDSAAVSILGWDRPAGGDPLDHGVQFLHHLARLPQTARFVCRKLAVRFVADDPGEELVDAMAGAWAAHDSAIAPVIRAMVEHPAFAGAAPKFNRPWDFLVQTLRALDADVDVASPLDRRALSGVIRGLGQPPFRHATPDGYPDTEADWLTAGGLLARWNLVLGLTLPSDRPVVTGVTGPTEGLEGSSAAAVFDHFANALRHESPEPDQIDVLTDLTGWAAEHLPSRDELDGAAPLIAFALLADRRALYR